MNLSTVIKNVKSQNKLQSFTPIDEDIYKAYFDIENEEGNPITYKEFQSKLNEHGLDINNIWYQISLFPKFIYMEDLYPLRILCLLNNDLDSYMKDIKYVISMSKECWQEKKYTKFFMLIEDSLRLDFFCTHYKKIDKESVYEVFVDLYTDCDMDFSFLSPEIISYVYQYADRKAIDKQLNSIADKEGYITIYRGSGTKSTPIEKAYSWSTSISTALMFGYMYCSECNIYKGRIHKEKVIDFIDDRSESEVLCHYKDISDVKILNKYKVSEDDFEDFHELTKKYKKLIYSLNEIKDILHDIDGVHGILHIQRVVLLTLFIASKLNFSDKDKRVLQACALLHDIGREDEGENLSHGENAVKLIENNEYIKNLFNKIVKRKHDQYICKQVISGHCISDEIIINSLMNDKNVKEKNRAVYLYKWFKDIDALDRVRFRNELDERYLRNPEAIDFIGVASEFVQNVKKLL